MSWKEEIRSGFVRHKLWKVVVTIAVFLAASLLYYFHVRKEILHDSEERAEKSLVQTEKLIRSRLGKVETTVDLMRLFAESSIDNPDKMYDIVRYTVESSPSIISASIAFSEYFYPDEGRWFQPYASFQGNSDSLAVGQLGTVGHDYTVLDWYIKGLKEDAGDWSDPYFDSVVSKSFMMTYSHVIYDKEGSKVGLISADVTLDTISSFLTKEHFYENSFFTLETVSGLDIVPPASSNGKFHIFERQMPDKNMVLRLYVKDADMYSRLRKTTFTYSILALLGMIAFLYIAYQLFNNLVMLNEVNVKEQQIERELDIARKIQMSFIPSEEKALSDKNIDISGMLNPAKYVGGDIYDYCVNDNKLLFCIGDVSGKGVPGAMLMAIVHSLFRSLSTRNDSPDRIMRSINRFICHNNNDLMFVTMFIGSIDLGNGRLLYCNAGHNPPLVTSDGMSRFLDTEPDLILGIEEDYEYSAHAMSLESGDSIFLYTDGLSEAENEQKQMFGNDKTLKSVEKVTNLCAKDQVEKVYSAVKKFSQPAEQSDDIGLLAIRYLSNNSRLVLHNKIPELDKLHPFLSGFFEENGLEMSVFPKISLAIEEALANVIMYAYPESQDGLVSLVASVADSTLYFKICDSGKQFNPLLHQESNLSSKLEERSIGGLGIHIIKEVMDALEYEYNDFQNTLLMSKKI